MLKWRMIEGMKRLYGIECWGDTWKMKAYVICVVDWRVNVGYCMMEWNHWLEGVFKDDVDIDDNEDKRTKWIDCESFFAGYIEYLMTADEFKRLKSLIVHCFITTNWNQKGLY